MLYRTYQAQRDLTAPVVALASLTVDLIDRLPPWFGDNDAVRWFSATNEFVARSRLTHKRPSFGIDTVTIDGEAVPIREEIADSTPFGSLLHFAKESVAVQPRVLVVAALAGHFSTLLRPTVSALLSSHDVYITDWHNARDVPPADGEFGFDEYVDHLIRFLRRLGPGAHAVAVCQPCPATLAATAVMAEEHDPATPNSLTLMAGPVDCRMSPTAVDDLANQVPLSWFEANVITRVPFRYAGAGRRVYPGFLQLGGFMSMNPERHIDQHVELFHDLVVGDAARADTIKAFYDEYLAVMDLPAEFYLQTIDRIFQRHLLPRGELVWRGRPVRPAAISKTALLTVEGGRDDICGIGQTQSAQDLCIGIPTSRRAHHLQANVGHYGVFSGSAWEHEVSPVVSSFILAND
jgi:poly(3-hydroxybutyrate) depolymerase